MSAAMYTTADVVLARVARVWGRTVEELLEDKAAHWAGICADAAVSASGLIGRILTNKQYTTAQIAADASIPALAARIACCHALREGGLTREEVTEKIKLFCECEKELETYPLMNDVKMEPPTGSIGYGRLKIAEEIERRCNW